MKLGIVGSGVIVREFVTLLPSLKGIEITALCGTERSKETVNKLKDTYNIKNVFLNYKEFLNNKEIDTVYIAVPNSLHYQFAKEALEAGKNVIVEKPFVSDYNEALILNESARERGLFIFEAISTLYLPNYKKIKELLPRLGNIKIVQCNYSQYSRRYDSFKKGEILPAFNPELSGGALMDLNIYNIHYVVGLFGKPLNIEYFPNLERGIDTSGILMLDYGSFKCTCIGAKDCRAPIANNIQGDLGCIYQDSSANVCESFEMIMNDGTSAKINENNYSHRMINEFLEFEEMISNNELARCYERLYHSLLVTEVQTIARRKGGVRFPSDSAGISTL